MIKRMLWICGIICTAVLFIYISYIPEKKIDSGIQLRVFASGTGWGYQIEKQQKILIYQPYIPVIQGQKPFPTFESAQKMGYLVLEKICKGQIPVITREELLSGNYLGKDLAF